jgi:hypothetical protein
MPNKFRLHEAYLTDDGKILWVTNQMRGKQFDGYAWKEMHRKAIRFHRTAANSADDVPPFAAPVDILSQTEHELRTTR